MTKSSRYVFLCIILCACGDVKEHSTVKEDKVETNEHDWLKDLRIPRNSLVVEFSYELAKTEMESEGVEMVSFADDTTTYSFVAEMPVGCLIIGDLDTSGSNNYLLIGQACNPTGGDIVTESAYLKFTFRLRDHKSLLNKKLLFKTHADLLK